MALKRSYRERLRQAVPGLGFVYLELNSAVAERPGHFMPASMIDSQFAILESPHGESLTLVLDASRQDVPQLAVTIDEWWRRPPD